MIRVIKDENNILICAWRVGICFFKEQDEEVDGRETLVGRRGAALVGLCQRKVRVEL